MQRSTKIAIGMVALTVAAVFWWMLTDDPSIHHSTNIEDYVPGTEQGIENWRRLYDLSKAVGDQVTINLAHSAADHDFADPEELLVFEAEHRDDLAKEFADLQPYFEELRDLAASGPIGSDSDDFSDPIISFSGIRSIFRAAVLEFELCVAKHQEPCDISNLLAIMEVSTHWYPHSRTIVEHMIAVVILNQTLGCLLRNLPHLTQEQLLRVRDLLQADATDYPAGLITSLWTEYCMTANSLEQHIQTDGSWAERTFLLPNATINDYGDAIARAQVYYESKSGPGVARAFEEVLERNRELRLSNLRNLPGRLFLDMALPAFSKIFSEAARVNQQRDDLLAAIDKRLAELETTENQTE